MASLFPTSETTMYWRGADLKPRDPRDEKIKQLELENGELKETIRELKITVAKLERRAI